MVKRMQKSNVACIDVSMWEIAQGPHFDDLQRLLESFWIPDTTSTDNFLLQYDLIIVPDPVLAKVHAYIDQFKFHTNNFLIFSSVPSGGILRKGSKS